MGASAVFGCGWERGVRVLGANGWHGVKDENVAGRGGMQLQDAGAEAGRRCGMQDAGARGRVEVRGRGWGCRRRAWAAG